MARETGPRARHVVHIAHGRHDRRRRRGVLPARGRARRARGTVLRSYARETPHARATQQPQEPTTTRSAKHAKTLSSTLRGRRGLAHRVAPGASTPMALWLHKSEEHRLRRGGRARRAPAAGERETDELSTIHVARHLEFLHQLPMDRHRGCAHPPTDALGQAAPRRHCASLGAKARGMTPLIGSACWRSQARRVGMFRRPIENTEASNPN